MQGSYWFKQTFPRSICKASHTHMDSHNYRAQRWVLIQLAFSIVEHAYKHCAGNISYNIRLKDSVFDTDVSIKLPSCYFHSCKKPYEGTVCLEWKKKHLNILFSAPDNGLSCIFFFFKYLKKISSIPYTIIYFLTIMKYCSTVP